MMMGWERWQSLCHSTVCLPSVSALNIHRAAMARVGHVEENMASYDDQILEFTLHSASGYSPLDTVLWLICMALLKPGLRWSGQCWKDEEDQEKEGWHTFCFSDSTSAWKAAHAILSRKRETPDSTKIVRQFLLCTRQDSRNILVRKQTTYISWEKRSHHFKGWIIK